MAGEGGKRVDFYGVMGLKKECSEAELRNAYKKLALRWHPDRCSASGNLKFVEEAKKKFQAIQEAYSVLSDSNKRFLYDVGVYDCDDDDDENGMGDFLNEMATMMRQNKSNNANREGNSSFEELKELFEDMFDSTDMDMDGSFDYPSSSSKNKDKKTNTTNSDQSASSSLLPPLSFDPNFSGFCFGTGGKQGKCERSKRRK
jgi:DnaJ family protein B protein 6